ncbi:MAG: MarR family transcriptional regulator [Clostridiaceae bacterium]|nr:MarR family transcriptional regulator [Clostridiaceae bacterium]
MTKEEILSSTFDKVTERHNIINSLAETSFISEHNVLEVHCIDLIDKIEEANVTKLAKAFRMTRGAISKIAKRLIKAGAIEIYQKPENKKEIYYKLTELGRTIYLKHEELHKNRINRDSLLFSQLGEDEKDSLIKIFEKIDMNLKYELEKMGIKDNL